MFCKENMKECVKDIKTYYMFVTLFSLQTHVLGR